ncbi:MAG: hypothetical protein U0797_09440 [Gemmataceae bacterium]
MSPPLRTKDDVQAILQGLRDGTIDVIATDHLARARRRRCGWTRRSTASSAWRR